MDLLECRKLLENYEFQNITSASTRSTFDLFEADFEDKHFYVKIAPSGHPFGENLLLQRNVLAALYPELPIYFSENSKLVFLAVLELDKPSKYDFDVANSLVENDAGKNQLLVSLVPPNRNMDALVSKAGDALKFFENGEIVSKDLCKFLTDQVNTLKAHIGQTETVVNHGDVSNPNIFLLNNRPILLDWEDIMIGYPGYDQVYWLTFLANLDQVTQRNLEEIPTSLEVVHATFFLVVVLKEYLQTFKVIDQNRISVEKRLLSLFRLPTFG